MRLIKDLNILTMTEINSLGLVNKICVVQWFRGHIDDVLNLKSFNLLNLTP